MGLGGVIACDIDDVLAPWRRKVLPCLVDHLGKDVGYEELTSPDLADCFGIRPVEMKQAIEDVRPAFTLNELLPIDDALLAIESLKRAGRRLVIITSRHDEIALETRQWVEKHLGPEVPVLFSQSAGYIYGGGNGRLTKLELARRIGTICLIEDNPREFMPEFTGMNWPYDEIMAICFAQPWNRDVQSIDPRIKRLDWSGILNLLLPQQHL